MVFGCSDVDSSRVSSALSLEERLPGESLRDVRLEPNDFDGLLKQLFYRHHHYVSGGGKDCPH